MVSVELEPVRQRASYIQKVIRFGRVNLQSFASRVFHETLRKIVPSTDQWVGTQVCTDLAYIDYHAETCTDHTGRTVSEYNVLTKPGTCMITW